VFVARHGRHELTNLLLSRAQVDELVERMLKSSGRRVDLSRPFVDAMLPEGHRLRKGLPVIGMPLTLRGTSVRVRCSNPAKRPRVLLSWPKVVIDRSSQSFEQLSLRLPNTGSPVSLRLLCVM
jgi:Flp pilus assembly CpaF family ATPase